MKHIKRISRSDRPQTAENMWDILYYIDSFGWLLVNLMNYLTAFTYKAY